MADNYLEKKMDDYRRGVNRTPRRSVVSSTRPSLPGCNHPLYVAVLLRNTDLLHQLIPLLGKYDLKVAFCGTDLRQGNSMAQCCGAMFIPVNNLDNSHMSVIDTIISRWNSVDIIVTDIPSSLDASLNNISRTIFISSDSVEKNTSFHKTCYLHVPTSGLCDITHIANAITILLSPLSEAITRVDIRP